MALCIAIACLCFAAAYSYGKFKKPKTVQETEVQEAGKSLNEIVPAMPE
jgi:hypothetical protein